MEGIEKSHMDKYNDIIMDWDYDTIGIYTYTYHFKFWTWKILSAWFL
jgi:hypothetical protein